MADRDDNQTGQSGDEMDVQLNEAFERLERRAQPGAAKPVASGANPRANPRANPGGRNVIGLLALLFAIVAVGAGGYANYRLMTLPDMIPPDVSGELPRLREQLDQLNQQVNARAVALEQQLTGDRRSVKELRTAVTDAVGRLAESGETSGSDWLFAEIEYLLRMANQRILMERDPKGAIGMLNASDQILSEAEDLTAHGLRQAIALDLASLKAVAPLDVEGAYLSLGAQIAQVEALQQPERRFEAPEEIVESAEPEEAGAWEAAISVVTRFGQTLSDLVDFRRDQPEIVPILPPEEIYYLRQNLILKLQMAQLALLSEESAVYSTSIRDAANWVTDYFDQTDPVSLSMLAELNRLGNLQITRELPDVSRSLAQARMMLAELHQQKAPKPAASPFEENVEKQ